MKNKAEKAILLTGLTLGVATAVHAQSTFTRYGPTEFSATQAQACEEAQVSAEREARFQCSNRNERMLDAQYKACEARQSQGSWQAKVPFEVTCG
ncbi:hypothetical protein [Erythrobacter sp. Alg231-14]|uniref:hypothetical protein n=1 Tax=Erythrobacter sp. Alg231-14 TaxID=1922225 RepID=UPI00307BAC8B